ncbi:MAG TPA: alpha/beta fold hydrolase [Candidatus Saccharimonadales bacterium]|nr:alpha/beta fold hydrolase [Candidatus Saccharimonadales bacterium]
MQDNKPTVLILHGIGGHAGIHWQQWLHDELQQHGYHVLMPDLSNSDHPDRQQWLTEIKQAVSGVDIADLIMVGHSLGVTSALDYIEQSEEPIKALVSVSGFAIDYGLELNSYFLKEKDIDLQKVRSMLDDAIVFYGEDDPYVTQEALKQLADGLSVEPVIIHEGGHLNTERGYTTFPQLLDAVLNSGNDNGFTQVVNVMANTPPISNEELIRHNRERKS